MADWQAEHDTDRVVAAIEAASKQAHNDNAALLKQLTDLNDQIGSLREMVERISAWERKDS